jgi:type IV pilus assembly protein PilX
MRPISPNSIYSQRRWAYGPLANERGGALILAIAMLAILSVLGSLALMTSNTEMKITGNYQTAKQTFVVADRAVEYATSRDILMSIGSVVDLTVAPHKAIIEQGGGGVLMTGEVRDLGPRDLPAKIAGTYGSDFGANFYQVSAIARQSATHAATVRIDTAIVRIFKNDDESIFITGGGG